MEQMEKPDRMWVQIPSRPLYKSIDDEAEIRDQRVTEDHQVESSNLSIVTY